MGLMDKVKNLFTEEVEEEVEVIDEPIKKEVIQVEIPSPAVNKKSEIKDDVLPQPDAAIEEKKDDYKFPFFDDDDFHELDKKPVIEKKKREIHKQVKEVYNPIKEEKKVFKPTPIISPVYGILDKNYQKEDIRPKGSKPRSYYDPKEASVDEIRNKAYGTLEDDIETTLFGKNHLMFDNTEKKEDVEDEIIEINSSKTETTENLIGERPRHGAEKSEDLTDLLEAELEKNEKPHKISDKELFSMIDSMYQKGGKKDDN